MKKFLSNYFGFTKSEINGLVFLIILLVSITGGMYGYQLVADKYASKKTLQSDKNDIVILNHLYTSLLQEQKLEKKNTIKKNSRHHTPSYVQKNLFIDINTADAKQLQKMRGIGPVLSQRIIKYRNKLGGFIDKKQFAEVYGLNEDVLKTLRKHTLVKKNFSPKKININTATFKTLLAHPYITYDCVQNIVQYRREHGYFRQINDLKNVYLLNDAWIKKMHCYLTFDVPKSE